MPKRNGSDRPVRGFTLVELLVVIGIMVILIAILIPAIGRIRITARTTETSALIKDISAAIEAYNNDFRAYPGPLSNVEVNNGSFTTISAFSSNFIIDSSATGFETTDSNFPTKITMSENLVLGLMGGLRYDTTQTKWLYDPRQVSNGPNTLMNTGLNKHYGAYVTDQKHLSWRTQSGNKTGHFLDELGAANDTIIPEFVDTYTDPLPLLYLRAKKGAAANSATTYDQINNTIITYDTTNESNRVGQYDLHQIIGYTGAPIGTGRKPPTYANWVSKPTHGLFASSSEPVNVKSTIHEPAVPGATYYYPFNPYAYFRNQSLSTPMDTDATNYPAATNRNDVPYQKDGFIIISAGPDRIYGTKDDVTNFGAVGQ